MRMSQLRKVVASFVLFGCACWSAAAATTAPAAEIATAATGAQPIETASSGEAGFVLTPQNQTPDPCAEGEVVSSPSRPYWDAGAATTQCGIVETDFGWLGQPMGDGIKQWMLVSSVRYGLTPKMDLRWGVIAHISQSGGGGETLHGTGDQCVDVTYRFHEQGRRTPAMAIGYGLKIPVADPDKGFGSGRADDQVAFIASRDLGGVHLDFDIVGTVTDEAEGHDGSAQFGLALTRQMTHKLAWILESYGGPQPGTEDRYGAALTGVSYSLKSWLVLDGAYVKTYPAGSPRQQILFGITHSMRPKFGPLPRGSRFARLLGR